MPTQTLDQFVIADLKSLGEGGEQDFFFEQTKIFAQRGRALLEALNDAFARNDIAGVRRTAHAFAGSAAVMGAARLKELCLSLEERSRQEPADGLLKLCYRIGCEFEEAERELLIAASDIFIEIKPWVK